MSESEHPFPWRTVVLSALLPTLVFSTGEGALIPIIAIIATNLGATLAVAGLIAAMLTIGQLIGDIPSGWVVGRIGERRSMIGASLLSAVAVSVAIAVPTGLSLGIAALVVGLAAAVFALARHAFMTTTVPLEYRARALSTLGGTHRLGFFIGPFLGALAIHLSGDARSVLWIQLGASLLTALIVIIVPDPDRDTPRPLTGEIFVQQEAVGLFRTIWQRRHALLTLGAGASILAALRSSRMIILPLFAVSIGIGETETAIIIGVAGAIDFALFYASGQIMDRFGRIWSGVPGLTGLALGHLVLALTHDLPSAFGWFLAAAAILAIANGISSGILMTIGADLADRSNPAPFLGAWRFTNDVGGASAPLIVAGATAAISISAAAGIVGVIGLLGAGILLRYIPRYPPQR